MKARTRLVVFLLFGAGGAAPLLWGFANLPAFGHDRGPYGTLIRANAVRQRHATNAVAAVVFDYRGFDTVGEEFIFFAAVMGVSVLLRSQVEGAEQPVRDRAAERRLRDTSDAVRAAALVLVGPTVVLGLYIVAHGHLTPGGGFQGGVILAGAPVLVYQAGHFLAFRRISPHAILDLGEGAGAAGFAIVGLIGLVAGASYLSNVLPLGEPGLIFSGGMLPVINLAVALEVSAGVVVVVFDFLGQTLMVRRG
jgi:multicomponent Na+:H+ antiporter subunit B